VKPVALDPVALSDLVDKVVSFLRLAAGIEIFHLFLLKGMLESFMEYHNDFLVSYRAEACTVIGTGTRSRVRTHGPARAALVRYI